MRRVTRPGQLDQPGPAAQRFGQPGASVRPDDGVVRALDDQAWALHTVEQPRHAVVRLADGSPSGICERLGCGVKPHIDAVFLGFVECGSVNTWAKKNSRNPR